MRLHDLTEFFRLSSALNYNLSSASLNRYNVLMFIIGGKRLHEDENIDRDQKGVLMEALNYLYSAYSQKRRRLGPMAVLHPLRATALLARTLDALNLSELLTALFHDILEDINSTDFKVQQWKDMEGQLDALLNRLDPEDEGQLVERLLCLTRLEKESYFQYIGRMLEGSDYSPDILHVKLADRLDNTLDMRMDLRDPLEGIDFYQNIFQLMFVNSYRGYEPEAGHPPPAPLNGARRLYQLFKNAVLLSLIRQHGNISMDKPSEILFDSICEASLNEAKRTLIHILGYHLGDVAGQRTLLLEAMDYCYSGGTDLATRPDEGHLMDGLFSTYFGSVSSAVRNKKLDTLYQNKPLMTQASIAFIVIFLSFLNDPAYYVKGISSEGIAPRES
ncbi:MAG: hypothetical protein JRI75_03120 [Deltaproteobacteria bacterium]|nr:hypothetical protein [Deltaproteobacteria bacterium]